MSIYKKIGEIQQEIEPMVKDKEVSYKSTHYKYFDINQLLEVLLPMLEDKNLVLMQPLTVLEEGVPAIKTVLYDTQNDEKVEDTTPIIYKERNPQRMGGAITYYRRYSLQSLLGLQAEDDDANAASGHKIKKSKKTVDDIPKK